MGSPLAELLSNSFPSFLLFAMSLDHTDCTFYASPVLHSDVYCYIRRGLLCLPWKVHMGHGGDLLSSIQFYELHKHTNKSMLCFLLRWNQIKLFLLWNTSFFCKTLSPVTLLEAVLLSVLFNSWLFQSECIFGEKKLYICQRTLYLVKYQVLH